MQARPHPAVMPLAALDGASRLARWARRHRATVLMAGLLAFAGPLKFLLGYMGVQHDSPLPDTVELALWWLLYGAVLWVAMLVCGHLGARWTATSGREARVQALLRETDGPDAGIGVVPEGRGAIVSLRVPHAVA